MNLKFMSGLQAGYEFLGPVQFICNYLVGPVTLLFVDRIIQTHKFNILFYVSSFAMNLFLMGGLLVTFCQDSQNPNQEFYCKVCMLMFSLIRYSQASSRQSPSSVP